MAYVGSNVVVGSGVTHQAISYTPGANSNSLTLCVYSAFNALTVTWPSGFTQIATDSNVANNGPNAYMYIAQNPNSSTGTTSYDPSWGATTTDPVVTIVENSGRNTSITSNVSQGHGQIGTGSSPISVPLVGLTAAAGDDVLWFGAVSSSSNVGTYVMTAPSGYTSRQSGSAQVSGENAMLNVSTRDNFTGATGTLTGTATNAGNAGDTFGIVIALPVAAGGSGLMGQICL